MAKNQESINRSLFELLRSRGYAPTLLDTSGKEIPVPEEAEVFQFKFTKDGEEYGTVTASIDGLHKLVIYFSDDVANSEKENNGGDESWYKLLNHLKRFAQQHQLSFEVKNTDHLKYDMAKRDHMKKQEKISEGYYPMGKKGSYSDAVPTTKIIIQHSKNIEEGEQRYRNVAKIFVENSEGERFAVPTTKPGIARVYARHIAEGGTPYDEKGKHITSLCEEYQKMGAFVRATRNGQFNESAQQLVNEGINHYQSLRETLGRMTGHRGYNAYFESWTPSLMEDETDTSNLNELFVQETLDPRIESVMPILSKLHKKVAEMKEVDALAEWADSLTEAPGAETLKHDDDTEKSNLKAFDLAEDDDLQEPAIDELNEEEVEESALQAYLGNKKYGKEGMDALRKAGREHASKEKMAQVRAKYDKLDEEDVAEGLDPEKKARLNALIDAYSDATDPEYMGDDDYEDIMAQIRAEFGDRTADSIANGPSMHFPRPGHSMGHDDLEFKQMRKNMSPNRLTKLGKLHKQDSDAMKRDIKSKFEVTEDEFAGDYATGEAGQWRNKGPKAHKPATIGDLVGESQLQEMDKSEDKKGPEGKATPITPKKMADDAKKVLDKEKVKEGQEDLNALLRLLGK